MITRYCFMLGSPRRIWGFVPHNLISTQVFAQIVLRLTINIKYISRIFVQCTF